MARGDKSDSSSEEEEVLELDENVKCEGRNGCLNLCKDTLKVHFSEGGRSKVVQLHDVIGCTEYTTGQGQVGFTVHSTPVRKQSIAPGNAIREQEALSMLCGSKKRAHTWMSTIKAASYNLDAGAAPTPLTVHVIYNPFGGLKLAGEHLKSIVAPMLRNAGHITFHEYQTERIGHGEVLGQELQLGPNHRIVVMSGDGVIHEVVNGLMSREDWQEAIKTPLAVVGSGTGNGLAYSLGVGADPCTAIHALLKGKVVPLDVPSVLKGNKRIFTLQFVSWGLVSDVDVESESFRWMGDTRFIASAAVRILKPRTYKARLQYLEADSQHRRECTHECDICSSTVLPVDANHVDGPPLKTLEEDYDRSGWKTIEGEFVLLTAMNVAFNSKDILMGTYAHPSDGCIDLVLIRKASRMQTVKAFLGIEKGTHVNHKFVEYIKVKAFTLLPLQASSCLDIDGEFLPTSEMHMEMHPSLLSVVRPLK